ncbi:hypothetical protein [Sinorhizobium fredii]|uniref:hypothetical protein n=1 Tax=Rhizobium fredii TaxID=380 RepID=UPI0004B5EF21|nr:hypothetical protein [Sinorhizobium fredii]AWM24954.1 hypothetical protein AOX55_00001696 [Sinorhizobium fredii CCBAU 25509]
MLYAIALNKTACGFELGEVEEIDGKDIQPDDARIFVSREANIDWVAEAVLAAPNNGGGR